MVEGSRPSPLAALLCGKVACSLRAGDRLLTRDPACAGAARAQSENAREAGGVGSAVSSVHRGRYIVADGWWLSQNLSRKPPVAQGTGHRGPPWWSARRAC